MLVREKKKLLSLLMAVAVAATVVPTAAFANEAYTCGKEEHIHIEACYRDELTCNTEEHEHTESCYAMAEESAAFAVGDDVSDDFFDASGDADAVEPDTTEIFVTFNDNFFDLPFAVVGAEVGKALDYSSIPADPTFDGYTFEGWYLGDEKFDFAATITEDITLGAKWTKNDVPVVTYEAAYFILNPERGVPVNGADQGSRNYLPNEMNNGGVQGADLHTGYMGGVITQEAAELVSNGGERYTNLDDGLGDLVTPPQDLGDFDTANIVWYLVMKPGNYGSTARDGHKFIYHVDGYVKNYNVDVTYHSNFESDLPYNDKAKTGSYTALSYAATGLPTREGYTFLGWSEASGEDNTVNYSAGEQFTLMSGVQLYAVWVKNAPETMPDTKVTVWHFYGSNAEALSGHPVDAQKRDSTLITVDWADELASMDYYEGTDKDCFAYSTFELWAVRDGSGEQEQVFIGDNGHLDMTNLSTVAVHLVYDTVNTPVVYHSNFGTDTTARVLAAKDETGGFSHTVLSYTDSELPTNSGYTFLGWSTLSTGAATIAAGSEQDIGKDGMDLYAVWSKDAIGGETPSNPGGNNDNNNNNNDDDDGPARPAVTPPVEEVILPDDVPLGNLPETDGEDAVIKDEDVPLGNLPEIDGDDFVIVDEETPLGSLPRTGSAQSADPSWTPALPALAASMSAAGLALLTIRKREETEH